MGNLVTIKLCSLVIVLVIYDSKKILNNTDILTVAGGHSEIVLKGMVHMITMLTYIEQIDIGEYKKPF